MCMKFDLAVLAKCRGKIPPYPVLRCLIPGASVHAVAHGPMSQASSTLVWYSIAGMLSASVGASMLPVAKYAWERLEHLLAPMQDREKGAQVRWLYGSSEALHCQHGGQPASHELGCVLAPLSRTMLL